jgi:putative ABC transport system permease protein
LGLSSGTDVIYVPVQTMLLRVENRALVTGRDIKRGENDNNQSQQTTTDKNYNQLDKIILQVEETNQLQAVSEIAHRLLLRRHQEVADFEIVIPELLLKQQQRTKDIFNIVLGAIAGISLLVVG